MHRFAILALLIAVFAVAGCGDDDNGDDNAASNTPESSSEKSTGESAEDEEAEKEAADKEQGGKPADRTLQVGMDEFKFQPASITTKSGRVAIEATNKGGTVHELVLLHTNADPAKLPMEGGEVDESTSVGEIPDVEPGKSGSETFDLKPGKYVMVCALPGHYEGGMYGSLTVN